MNKVKYVLLRNSGIVVNTGIDGTYISTNPFDSTTWIT